MSLDSGLTPLGSYAWMHTTSRICPSSETSTHMLKLVTHFSYGRLSLTTPIPSSPNPQNVGPWHGRRSLSGPSVACVPVSSNMFFSILYVLLIPNCFFILHDAVHAACSTWIPFSPCFLGKLRILFLNSTHTFFFVKVFSYQLPSIPSYYHHRDKVTPCSECPCALHSLSMK